MTSDTGQTLRRFGLLTEAASVLAILGARRGYVGFWERSGLNPDILLPAAFLFGMVTWGVGTAVRQSARRKSSGGRSD